MSHLEKLKQTFDEIGVPYLIEDNGDGYVSLYTCSEEEQKQGLLRYGRDVFFEFCNEKLASSP